MSWPPRKADSLVSGKGEIVRGEPCAVSPPTSAWLINPCRWLYPLPQPRAANRVQAAIVSGAAKGVSS